jgi:hypothetical protein
MSAVGTFRRAIGFDKEFTTGWEGKDPLYEEEHYARVTQEHSESASGDR